jgi:glycosyltransferase involved in cell wall biosynthesis
MKELVIIIPVYNESKIIKKVIQDWTDLLTNLKINYEINIYNDGSTDNSLQILREIEAQNNRIKIIDKKNSGHGSTILEGYIDSSDDFEWIFQIDSDNEIGTESFIKLWDNRDKYDFLIGKRKYQKKIIIRRIISYIAQKLIYIVCGNGIKDVNCPYRLMRTKIFKKYFLNIPKNTFAPNILISGIVNKNNISYYEEEIQHIERQTGTVSIKRLKLLKVSIKTFFQTLAFFLK